MALWHDGSSCSGTSWGGLRQQEQTRLGPGSLVTAPCPAALVVCSTRALARASSSCKARLGDGSSCREAGWALGGCGLQGSPALLYVGLPACLAQLHPLLQSSTSASALPECHCARVEQGCCPVLGRDTPVGLLRGPCCSLPRAGAQAPTPPCLLLGGDAGSLLPPWPLPRRPLLSGSSGSGGGTSARSRCSGIPHSCHQGPVGEGQHVTGWGCCRMPPGCSADTGRCGDRLGPASQLPAPPHARLLPAGPGPGLRVPGQGRDPP